MIALAFTFFLCLVCAFSLESRLPLRNLLERVLVVFTLVAGQLILAFQLLSLFDRLTGRDLLFTCLAFALAGWGSTFLFSAPDGRPSWKTILAETWAEMTGRQLPALLVLASGVALISLHTVLGALMIPLGDSYHFEKPLFWVQHHTIAPFTVSNPRITATSFAGEALTLPGYLYCHSGLLFAVITFFAGCLSLAVVFSLAGKLGCSRAAAACAGLLLLGFSIFVLPFLMVSVDSYLAGLWVGASLVFLLECHGTSDPPGKEYLTRLGFSVVCFLMACGAKNSSVFMAPFYLVGMALCVRRMLFTRKVILVLALSGVLGVVCSGSAWNYIANVTWYGNSKGPPFMQSHLSREFDLRAVWTRLARGTALMAFDCLYVPAKDRDAYGALCQKAVRVMGGETTLAEDNPEFNNFDRDEISPRSGCGLAGMIFFLPALIASLRRMSGKAGPGGIITPMQRRNIAILLLCGVGYILASHILLRWQFVGLWRLMPAFPLIAAPLCGLLLEKFRCQLAALLMVGFSTLAFLTYDTGMMARRYESMEHNWFLKKISASSRQHGLKLEYQWLNEPRRELLVREDYASREVPQTFLQRVDPGAVIGFVGDVNSVIYYLFGTDFSNRIIPLNDSRGPDRLLPPPVDARYLVFGQDYKIKDDKIAWATNSGYAVVFQVFDENKRVFMGFEKGVPSGAPVAAQSGTPANSGASR